MLVTDRTDLYERCRVPARPRPATRKLPVLRHRRSGLQVPDERPAGRVRPGTARAARRARRPQARDLLVVSSSGSHDVPGVTLNYEPPGTHNTYWMVTIVRGSRVSDSTSRHMMDALRSPRGIETRPFFPPAELAAGVCRSARRRSRRVAGTARLRHQSAGDQSAVGVDAGRSAGRPRVRGGARPR